MYTQIYIILKKRPSFGKKKEIHNEQSFQQTYTEHWKGTFIR